MLTLPGPWGPVFRAASPVLAVCLVLLLGAAAAWAWHRADAPDRRLVYKQVGGHRLHLHVFDARRAGDSGGRRPAALLLFHGGGWDVGDPRQFHPQCRHLSRLGITCISVAYRVRSRHGSTPGDALEDARDALRWVRREADTLGIDAGRVAAGGGSAGGHLAAALGTGLVPPAGDQARDQPGDRPAPAPAPRPAALLLLNPMLDLSPGQPDHDRVAAHWQALSPMHHLSADVPPTLVLSGTDDPEVPVATVQAFCQRLQQLGVPCWLQQFQGAGHGFFNPQVDGGRHHRPALESMRDFLAAQALL